MKILNIAVLCVVAITHVRADDAPALTLSPSWNLGLSAKNGSLVARDLKEILTGHGEPAADLQAYPELKIYKEVTYLMPVKEATKQLGLTSNRSKVAVGCPGWPASSFSFFSFDGVFEGHYNRLLMVVDRADRVVAVQLVDEAPKYNRRYRVDPKWHTYDFVQTQSRGDSTCRIAVYAIQLKDSKIFQIVSQFYGKSTSNHSASMILQEDVALFLPRPMVSLLLYCLQ